jgi:2-polyprenyl-6-methoxyphenol hydroxylase-like FAD-dependent oxidoreductase
MLPQDVTEKTLADRLAALGGTIYRGVAATSVQQTADRVQVSVASQDGESAISARYVVGADGMHSKVRAAADIKFEGAPYSESFVLADVHMDWPLRDQDVSLFFSAAGLAVIAPLPNGSYRSVATLADAPERPGVEDIQRLIYARGPTAQPARVKDDLSSRFASITGWPRVSQRSPVFSLATLRMHSPAVRACADWSTPACSANCCRM